MLRRRLPILFDFVYQRLTARQRRRHRWSNQLSQAAQHQSSNNLSVESGTRFGSGEDSPGTTWSARYLNGRLRQPRFRYLGQPKSPNLHRFCFGE